MSPLRVAAAQYATGPDLQHNARLALAQIERAADAGARLVVLPEYAIAWRSRLRPELADGHERFDDLLAGAARRHRVHVVAGSLAPSERSDRLRNVALIIGPDGQRVAHYDKVHLFDAFGVRESDVLTAGRPAAVVVDVDGWAVGVATCYDLRFPEIFRDLSDHGAALLAVGAAWAAGPGKVDQLGVLARARALENTCYLALASQSGTGRSGGSAIIDPLGRPLAQAGSEAELLVVDAQSDQLQAIRERLPVRTHRRYDVVPRP